jgi:hypothetical protein
LTRLLGIEVLPLAKQLPHPKLGVTPTKYRKELASLLTLNFQHLGESLLHTIDEDEQPVSSGKRAA